MSASPRPNLGGLFNGSTPPERSSSIAEALGPRGVRLSAVTDDVSSDSTDDAPADVSSTARPAETRRPQPIPIRIDPPAPPRESGRPAPNWLNPVTAVEHYFAFLQTLLDANQRLALSVTRTLVSLPERAKIWR